MTKKPEHKTKLELILDGVRYAEREVTFDLELYTYTERQKVIDAAEKRGLHTAFDGRWLLVRDLRSSATEGAND